MSVRACAKKQRGRSPDFDFVVFECDVQTILDADHHLDRVVTVRWYAERVHPKIFFLYHRDIVA